MLLLKLVASAMTVKATFRFSHNLSDLFVLHTLTHQVLSSSRNYSKDIEGCKSILIAFSAAKENTSSMKKYLTYWYHVGCTLNNESTAATSYLGNGFGKLQGDFPKSSLWVLSPSLFINTFSATYQCLLIFVPMRWATGDSTVTRLPFVWFIT